MKTLYIMIIAGLTLISSALCQDDVINSDYLKFGRKEPASLGSVFSALGDEPVFHNPG